MCLLGFAVLALLLASLPAGATIYVVYAWPYLLVAASREWGTVLRHRLRVVLVLFPCLVRRSACA